MCVHEAPTLPTIHVDHSDFGTREANYQKVNDKLKATENTDGGKLTCGDKDWLFRKTWKDMGSRFQNPEGTVGRGMCSSY